MRYNRHGFTVTIEGQDWVYAPGEEQDDDCIKIWHDVIGPDGDHTYMPWAPYSYITPEQLTRWVELGRPRPMVEGKFPRNLTPADLA